MCSLLASFKPAGLQKIAITEDFNTVKYNYRRIKYQILNHSPPIKFSHPIRTTSLNQYWFYVKEQFVFLFTSLTTDGLIKIKSKFVIATVLRILFHTDHIISVLCLTFTNKFLSPLTEEAIPNWK